MKVFRTTYHIQAHDILKSILSSVVWISIDVHHRIEIKND